MKTIGRYSLAIAADGTTQSATVSGLAKMEKTFMAVVVIPNWTNNVTLTYSHVLLSTAPVYSIASLARNQPITAPAVLLYDRPIYNGCVLTVTLSGVPGGTGGTVTVDLFMEG